MNNDIKKRLEQIRVEDYIWIVYTGIIALSLYANRLERKYFVNNDLKSKTEYRNIMIAIFLVLYLVYSYFLKDSWDDFKNINKIKDKKKRDLITLSFLGSLLIFISGAIFLYIAIVDENIDVELAFN